MVIIIFMLISMKLCKTIGVFVVEILWHIIKLIIFQPYLLVKETKIEISTPFGHFSISSWSEKGHELSWAKLKILQLSSDSTLLSQKEVLNLMDLPLFWIEFVKAGRGLQTCQQEQERRARKYLKNLIYCWKMASNWVARL